MKRTCNYCRALDGVRCDLGYANESRGVGTTDQTGYFSGRKPSERCPKPLTMQDWGIYKDVRDYGVT